LFYPFSDFPREIGNPLRCGIVNNKQELSNFVNTYNGKTKVFTSLYSFDEIENKRGIYESARINKIYFDFDNPETSLLCANKLHNYSLEHDYSHCIFFSGGGFHVYIKVNYPNNLKNKKASVGNAQYFIADENKINIGINGNSDLDGHIIGNIAQLVRIPNTYNIKRKKFCIPISDEDLKTKNMDDFKGLANRQRFEFFSYGKGALDIEKFDGEEFDREYEISDNIESGSSGITIDIEKLPPCIKEFTTKKHLKHGERYLFILYCRELGLLYEDTLALMKTFLEPKVFFHCVKQERQPFWTYRRKDLIFPSCETLKERGFCTKPNCKGLGIYQ
jgi:hypothetical protein